MHHGRVRPAREGVLPALVLDGGEPDGAQAGSVLGSMVHGLLDHAGTRHALLRWLRPGGPWQAATVSGAPPNTPREAMYDALADHVSAALDMDRVRAMVPRP